MLKLAYFLRNLQNSLTNNSRILRIKNAKFSGCCFYINTNLLGDFQICISVPLICQRKVHKSEGTHRRDVLYTFQFLFLLLAIFRLPFCFSRSKFSLVARWNSLVARYSLLSYSLLVVKLLVTHCKIRSVLVAEVARWKNSLVTHWKICSLLVAEIVRYKKLLVTRCEICLFLVATNHSLLVTEDSCCKKSSSLVKTITSK